MWPACATLDTFHCSHAFHVHCLEEACSSSGRQRSFLVAQQSQARAHGRRKATCGLKHRACCRGLRQDGSYDYDLARLMDGPDLSVHSTAPSNLGAMRSVLESGGVTRADELAMQEAVGTFRAGGQEFSPAFDPLASAGSSVLLVILLGIAFERVLGLDRLIAQALRQWKEGQRERERRTVMDARVKLEDEFNKPD